ncbi:uncharacterized protein EV154DRAFT_561193 [Mucor mucedo]|uniref:uncharacterized protein n=1 Tax=Mucor mucedo TaxID=29922 RepID=UPI00221F6F43|nr:uncharacterized protein EV154DRAFT_561193 [Mucor mucedo]KAI7893688.1 hypothetical protein EV154DRAFT_561193 [Mucor mucedo]
MELDISELYRQQCLHYSILDVFYDLNDIVLPSRDRPGTDMISKLILQERPIFYKKTYRSLLIPFASICLFLMRQDSSLLRSRYNSDETIEFLYRLAQRHVGTTIIEHERIVDEFLSFSIELKTRLEEAINLQENDNKNAAVSQLKNTISLVNSYQEKCKVLSTAADSDPVLSGSASLSSSIDP